MFTLNVDLFFLSIPLPGFISSDRFAWNGPVRLLLISSVLILLGKTKSFVFPSKRRTDEINGNLSGPIRLERSDGIKPGIGIEKNYTYRLNRLVSLRF